MPVKCKLISGKFRIIGPDGKVETNKAGTPVDGTGHDTMAACVKQAGAINMNLATWDDKKDSMITYEGGLPFATSSMDEDEKQRFKKDMIKVGFYTHPIHKWKLNVTSERLQRWLTNFKAMRENGIDIEVPLDHSLSAEKNLGYVIDAMIEPDSNNVLTLFGIIEVTGQNAIDIVRRNKNVSVWISQNYKDGKANSYGEVIKHCAIVQQPVVGQQDDFIPIAASEKGVEQNIPIFYLGSKEMTKEQFEKLKKLYGFGDEVTEENVLSSIETLRKEQSEKMGKLQEANLSLKTQVSKSKAASQDKIDPNTLELTGTTIAQQLDMAVEKAKITPAACAKFKAALVGPQGNRNQLTLCLGEESAPSIASQVIEAINENDPVKLGEQTNAQVLGRETPGGEDDDKKADDEGAQAMSVGAGVEEEEKKS